jgi:hypothetical protein
MRAPSWTLYSSTAAVVHAQDAPRQGQDAGQIRRDAGESVAQAGHQPRALFDGIQAILGAMGDDKGVIPFQIVVGGADGRQHLPPVAVKMTLHGVDTGLAIVGAAHRQSLAQEQLAHLDVVDHVAIVGADHVAVGIQVGLGILVRRCAKGRPAELGDASQATHGWKVQIGTHVVDATHALAQIDSNSVRAVDCDRGAAHRVIATVGQPFAAIEEDGSQGLFVIGDDAKDTAHRMDSLRCCNQKQSWYLPGFLQPRD